MTEQTSQAQGQDLYSDVDLPKPTEGEAAAPSGELVALPEENVANVADLHNRGDDAAGGLDSSDSTSPEDGAGQGDEQASVVVGDDAASDQQS